MPEFADKKFYKKEGDKIVCLLCQHYCKLKDGQTGVCGANKNEDGKLKNLVYGRLVALHIDPIEKKPLYHFLPGSESFSVGTLGCNMQCPFCQNWHISQVRKSVDTAEYISPENLVKTAVKYKCKSIAYTYNEPTIFYPFARDTAMIARKHGIKNIFVTNGIESKEVIQDMPGIINACNVDFKSFNPDFYKKVLKSPFGVLDTMKLIKKLGIWLETTTLIVPGENDSEAELNQIAGFIANELGTDTPWHISAFYPQYKMNDKIATPRHLLQKAYALGKKNGLKYIYMGNIGVTNTTFCPKCGTALIERKGYHIFFNKIINGKCPVCSTEINGLWG